MKRQLAVLVLALGAVPACSGLGFPGSSDKDGCYENPKACIESSRRTTYVVDTLAVPANSATALEFGLDLDGDPAGRIDNQLGVILPTLNSVTEVDLQTLFNEAIADGTMIMLVDMIADDIDNSSSAGGELRFGKDAMPSPCVGEGEQMTCGHHLQGDASFAIDDEADVKAIVAGRIADGRFVGGPAAVRFEIDLPKFLARPLNLEIVGARAVNRVGADGLSEGIIAGGARVDELLEELLPNLIDTVARDCKSTTAPCCEKDSAGATILELFDEDEDCQLTLESLLQNQLLQTVLEPDLDLLDGRGNFNPREDFEKDTISAGFGFTALPTTVRGK
jgi:hypothetical protein